MAQSSDSVIKSDSVRFSSDSQLLSELGERLIATRKVALAELIKNAYDADATTCHIWLEGDDTLVIQDDGHGMTESDFRQNWMTIATPNRNRSPKSRRYGRDVTGSKGVGRFAVRNLGLSLELESVAYDDEANEYRRLVANFDWNKFESGDGLREMEIDYQIEGDASESEEGTRLRISELQDTWSQYELESVSNEVVDIVSAPYEKEPSKVFGQGEDPGFSVFFARPGEESPSKSAAREIYERYVIRVEIDVSGTTVQYHFEHKDSTEKTQTYEIDRNLIGDVEGEIRFIPRRAGVLRDMETMNGQRARSWLRDNGGVRIIDRGFRMPPYGSENDDWLRISETHARRERDWRSSVTTGMYSEDSIPVNVKEAQLKLPKKTNILGSIHVASHRPGDDESPADRSNKLIPAMDRQGFIENDAMEQLRDLTRGALELLSIFDLERQREKKEEEAEEKKSEVESEVEETADNIRDRDDIDEETKEEIAEEVEEVGKSVQEYHEAQEEAKTAVESMHLLGVVTGFISHETNTMLQSAKEMLQGWEDIPEEERSPEIQDSIQRTRRAIEDIESHLDYSRTFIQNLDSDEGDSDPQFRPKYLVDETIENFSSFTNDRGITVENKIPREVEVTGVRASLYSGVVTNLYTNAVKAVSESEGAKGKKQIQFVAKTEDDEHILQVSDTGVGIPEERESEIFNAMESTTEVEGPMGAGTGMGLYIVRRVLDRVDGEIGIVEPPEGFETCFEVKV